MKYQRELFITCVVFVLALILKTINVFQVENQLALPLPFLTIVVIVSMVILFTQNKIDKNYETEQIHYSNLDYLKYIFAILILILHFRPFLYSSDKLDLAFNNIVTRICVPFFFLITGYFVAKKEKKNGDYIGLYIKKTIPLYLVWSILYIPVIIATVVLNFSTIQAYLTSLQMDMIWLVFLLILAFPVVLLIAFVYTGVYYHLWYFPALILSLLVLSKWKKKFPLKYLLGISFLLLLFGATETYYGILPISIKEWIQYYYNIFFTTRNFLFFGLFYVVLGYVMGNRKTVYSPYCFLKLIVSIFFLILEGVLIRSLERLNSNILLFCIPVVYYLFVSVLYLGKSRDSSRMRELSKYYYFLHPAVIFFLQPILKGRGGSLGNSFLLLFLVLGITHILSCIVIKFKNRYPKFIL